MLSNNSNTISVSLGLSMSLSTLSHSLLPYIYAAIVTASNNSYDAGMFFITVIMFIGTCTSVFLYIKDIEGNSLLDLRESCIMQLKNEEN